MPLPLPTSPLSSLHTSQSALFVPLYLSLSSLSLSVCLPLSPVSSLRSRLPQAHFYTQGDEEYTTPPMVKWDPPLLYQVQIDDRERLPLKSQRDDHNVCPYILLFTASLS